MADFKYTRKTVEFMSHRGRDQFSKISCFLGLGLNTNLELTTNAPWPMSTATMTAPATTRLQDWFSQYLGHMDTLLSEVDARNNPELATTSVIEHTVPLTVPLNAKPNQTTTPVATEKRRCLLLRSGISFDQWERDQTPTGTGKGKGKGKQPARCTAPPARSPPLPDLAACTNDAKSALQEYLGVLQAMKKDSKKTESNGNMLSSASSASSLAGCASESGFVCRAGSGQPAPCQTPSLQSSVFAKADALNTTFSLHTPIPAADAGTHTHGHEDEDGDGNEDDDDDRIVYQKEETRLLGYKPIGDISAPLDMSNVQAKVNSFRPRIERTNAKRTPKPKPTTSAGENTPHTTKPTHTDNDERREALIRRMAALDGLPVPAAVRFPRVSQPRVRGHTTKRSTHASAINTHGANEDQRDV